MKRLFLISGLVLLGQPANWPGVLEADVKSGNWEAAVRVGQATVEEIEAGRMFTRFSDVAEESNVRRLYAEALDHTGDPARAREQRCLARENPDASCAAQAALQRARRMGSLKADLLATQVNQPAAPLPFPQDGKVLVVVFWAKWCAPCLPEVDMLRRYRNSRAKVLPVDIDGVATDLKARFVPPESLEGPEIPQLYVFDLSGNIRFRVRGFENDGFFDRKLDWMIEAALK